MLVQMKEQDEICFEYRFYVGTMLQVTRNNFENAHICVLIELNRLMYVSPMEVLATLSKLCTIAQLLYLLQCTLSKMITKIEIYMLILFNYCILV